MPKGNLQVQITTLSGESVDDRVEVSLQRMSGEPGTGGEAMELSMNMGSDTDLTITGITCRGGP
jgi:hypothetical protein